MISPDDLLGYALIANDMRDRQKAYYERRTQSALIVMWEAQKLFDRRREALFGDKRDKPVEPKAE